MKIKIGPREISSGILGGVVSYVGVGFLQNFYTSNLQFAFLTILLNVFGTIVLEFVFDEISSSSLKTFVHGKIIPVLSVSPGLVFLALTIRLLLQYPTFFSFELFLLKPGFLPAFLGLTVLTKAGMVFLLNRPPLSGWRASRTADWVRQNLPGLVLASTIGLSTFAIATVFAQPGMVKTDNFFDADSGEWLNRLTADVEQLTIMRPVHPLAFLILRPPAWLVSVFLNGDRVYAAFLLNSGFGGVCVFLTWLFFRQRTANTSYSLLMAALLGFSNSHLVMSVFLESYIFSAAALIGFVLLLQRREKPLAPLVMAGLLTFGITMTNFIQTCILFFLHSPRFKTISRYVLFVVLLAAPLAFIQKVLYPTSDPFYLPASYSEEKNYQFNIIKSGSRDVIGRANTLTRSMFAFSMVAPEPLILLEETGCTFPCIQIYYYTTQDGHVTSSYTGIGTILVTVWVAMLTGALGLFLQKNILLYRSDPLPAALLLTLLFNLILHMNYGDGFLLYSPDWAYALVFFLGLVYEDFAANKWMHLVLLLFLTGLMINNLNLFRDMLDAILPFA